MLPQNFMSGRRSNLDFFHDFVIIYIIFIVIFVLLFILEIFLGKIFLVINFTDIVVLEIFWTLLPGVILIFLAIPRMRVLYLIESKIGNDPLVSIKIMAHQWYWSYEFKLEEKDSFLKRLKEIKHSNFRSLEADERIIVPSRETVRSIISSYDVLHAWAIPCIGIKVDAVPGRLNQLVFSSSTPGVFFGQCSELCGVNHRFIPTVIEFTNYKGFSFKP
jgi:cytochrome c oxidase subunit 2